MLVINGIVYKIGQIGSFLKVPLGYTNLYGIVTQIGASAIPENFNIDKNNFIKLANQQFLNIALIGEQTGKKFERGISQYPTTGDKVCLVTINDLDLRELPCCLTAAALTVLTHFLYPRYNKRTFF